jgi:DNA-binding NarL/FixJ family response regulator
MPVPVSVVEDDASVRQLLAEWINQAPGFHCLSQHAIALMDINLPDLTGIECVRRLKPVMPETYFVMLTVYEDSNHIFDALAAGAVGYLLKQTPCDQLIKSLKQVCAGGSPMSGYIARKVVQFFQQNRQTMPGVEALTARERQVLELLARGYLYKEITESLGITASTVNAHVRSIYEKLHVHTRTQAVIRFLHSQPQHANPVEGCPKESAPTGES